MATLDQVATALQNAVIALLNVADPPNPANQVGVGWPFGPSASEILGQYEAQVTIYPLTQASQNRTSRKPTWKTIAQPTVPMAATIAKQTYDSDSESYDDGSIYDAWTLTFANALTYDVPNEAYDTGIQYDGIVGAGLNVHTLVGRPAVDVLYQTQALDTFETVASKVATAIALAAIPGVTAVAIGASVNIVAAAVECNIGGSATMARESRRTMTPVQVSVWAADGATRGSLGAQIETALGLATAPFLQAADGSSIWVRMRGAPRWVDDSQSSYSLYEWHGIFECEYPTLQTTPATTVQSVGITVGDAPTIYTGG